MLQLTYSQIRNEKFVEAFAKLANSPMKNSKVAYVVAKVAQAIRNELPVMGEAWKRIVDEYAVRDENGKITPDENGRIAIDQTRAGDFQKQAEEFGTIQFETSGRPLTLDEIDGIALSPNELAALEGFLVVEE